MATQPLETIPEETQTPPNPPTPARVTPAQSENTSKEESGISLMTVLGIGALLVSAAGVYYQREAIMNRFKPAATPAPQATTPPAPTQAPSRIPVKRGIRKMED